jgi:hypothetical protein
MAAAPKNLAASYGLQRQESMRFCQKQKQIKVLFLFYNKRAKPNFCATDHNPYVDFDI